MAKASRIAASQAQSLADIRLLVFALCEKEGIDVDKVLNVTVPQTREEMKAYANKPAVEQPAAAPVKATPPAAQKQPTGTKLPAPKGKE